MPIRSRKNDTAIIFTYAPAGLGHLRVTNALYKGLPQKFPSHLLGAQDASITSFHRFLSIHPLTRSVMEVSQKGLVEDVFTFAYRKYLWTHTQRLYEQLLTLIDEHVELPKKLLVIASHFGLAHQLSSIKSRLFNERKIKLILVVQVTDDSPQQIWYVPGADLTVVPSQFTKTALERYGRLANLIPTNFVVLPYPLSPFLTYKLSGKKFLQRKTQLSPQSQEKIQVSIPISGAAVGTEFLSRLIKHLSVKSDRFVFHIISKAAPFTKNFLSEMVSVASVKLYVSELDREVVNLYDTVYTDNVIALEITKPSEQAFKALLKPKMIGGSVLLFSNPVGRQEYDNLYFLRRHYLLPKVNEQDKLFNQFTNRESVAELSKLHDHAKSWRGLRIPDDPQMAGDYIWWLFKTEILSVMTKWQPPLNFGLHKYELGSDGVIKFWSFVFAKFNL